LSSGNFAHNAAKEFKATAAPRRRRLPQSRTNLPAQRSM